MQFWILIVCGHPVLSFDVLHHKIMICYTLTVQKFAYVRSTFLTFVLFIKIQKLKIFVRFTGWTHLNSERTINCIRYSWIQDYIKTSQSGIFQASAPCMGEGVFFVHHFLKPRMSKTITSYLNFLPYLERKILCNYFHTKLVPGISAY